jgi:hypothetical protein
MAQPLLFKLKTISLLVKKEAVSLYGEVLKTVRNVP